MKKTIPWILLAMAILLIFFMKRGHDARVKDIITQSDADLAAASVKVREIQAKLEESKRQYSSSLGEVERLESELIRKPKEVVKVVTRTITKTATTEPPEPLIPVTPQDSFSFDWEAEYRDYVARNQEYIAGNQALRAEHDKMINDYEEMLGVERETIQELILARDQLAAMKRRRWGFCVGFQGGVSVTGHPYLGFGGGWGYQF